MPALIPAKETSRESAVYWAMSVRGAKGRTLWTFAGVLDGQGRQDRHALEIQALEDPDVQEGAGPAGRIITRDGKEDLLHVRIRLGPHDCKGTSFLKSTIA